LQNTNDAPSVIPLQDKGLVRTHANFLRTPGLLARWPLIGLLMILLGGIAFGVIAVSLQANGPLIQADVPVANAIHEAALHSSPFIRGSMIFGFYLGEQIIVVIGALLALYFLFKRFWPELCMVIITWAGEGSIWLVLSHYYSRHRPIFDVPIWHQMTTPGFPSGHAISAVMCYGLLAYLLVPKIHLRFWKAVAIGVAVLVILFIGYSRLFVGDHYLTDVLAGYALGIAWSGLAYSLVELIFKKRINRNVQKN
jgi:membrane-associated phospholipid phosphatase